MEYIRPVDPAKFDPTRFSVVTLASRESGSQHCLFRIARVPPGRGNESLHIHKMDKFYYILSGTMQLEIDGQSHSAGPSTLVFVPAGIPHRNWNDGPDAEEHLVIFVPEPEPGEPLVIPVEST